tara:strand:+ start:1494 stop:2030 length:537 start_codon:yes stop_codon:yes gene_type:complete
MDDLIFEMNQPNEIISHSEWTEWWVIDEKGLYLEYADGWSPEQEYGLTEKTETTFENTKSIYIDVNYEYDKKMKYLHDKYEDVFGKLDENFINNMYTECDIDLFADQVHKPFPITTSSIDYEEWPSDYLEYLRDIIDEYNSQSPYNDLSELRAETLIDEDPEERIIDVSGTDGLILPS